MWADSRNGLPRVHATQDVFAAVLAASPPAVPAQNVSPLGWKVAGLVAAGMAGVGLAALVWRLTSEWAFEQAAAVMSRMVGAAVVLTAVMTAGCAFGQARRPLPDPVPTVDIRLLDDDLEHPASVPPGRVVFYIDNSGKHVHRLALILWPQDAVGVHEELANDKATRVELLARTAALKPGQTGLFAVELEADRRYAMIDYSKAPDGTMHGLLGVAGEFRTDDDSSDPAPATR